MPPQLSSISNVGESAVIFRYKKFTKVSVILTVLSQIGITISENFFELIAETIDDPDDLLLYLTIIPMIIGPIITGYLLDKRYFCQVLFVAFLGTVIGQTFITISSAFSPINFVLILIGRFLYSVGFSMAIPSLVRFILLWLSPEDIPMGLATLFMVEILSQTVGSLLYSIFRDMPESVTPQVISLILCLISLGFAGALWHVDSLANRKNDRDYNLLIQPPPPKLSKLLTLPSIVWGILISTTAALATIYTYSIYQLAFMQPILGIDSSPYYGIFLGAFSMVILPISAKVIKIEKQKLKLLMFEQILGVVSLLLLAYSTSWFSYVPGLVMLGTAQATLLLTFFILLISIMKWEMIGMMIGIFFATRNIFITGIFAIEMYYSTYLEEKETEQEIEYRNLTFILVGIAFVVGFLLSLVTYFINKERRIIDVGREEIKESFRSDYSRSVNRLSELSQ